MVTIVERNLGCQRPPSNLKADSLTTASIRRRVLISAYACGPLEEPEAQAGWSFATAAARDNDVWVITRRRFADAIGVALRDNPELASHLHVIHIDLSDAVRRLWRHDWDMYWYYVLWQRELARTAKALHAEHQFDVAHHVTFANDWLPCGLAELRSVPLVWGPVGGASQIPYWRLREWLGWQGTLTEISRDLFTLVPRAVWGGRAARRAAVVVAQNEDVERHFARHSTTVVEANAALETQTDTAEARKPRTGVKTAVFAGRLIGLKGTRLCLEVIASTRPDEWCLEVYGDGYDREPLQRRAAQLGIAERVHFFGHRPRAEVLAAFERADAMLFPSMHDQAGWAVAEASSLGCPVVCLPLGGPPLLAEPNDFVASLEGDIVANLTASLRAAGQARGRRHNRWSRERLPALVSSWYERAIGTRAAQS